MLTRCTLLEWLIAGPRPVGAFIRGLHLDPRGVIMHVRSLREGDGSVPEGPAAAAGHRWWPRSEPPRAVAEFVCASCAKRWQEPIVDLDAWLEAHLEPEVRPA